MSVSIERVRACAPQDWHVPGRETPTAQLMQIRQNRGQEMPGYGSGEMLWGHGAVMGSPSPAREPRCG